MRRYTHEDEKELLRLYANGVSRASLAERFGTSVGAISNKLWKLGATPRGQIDKRIELTLEQENWLRREFPHVRSGLCAMRLGISLRSVVRIARRMGLEKTPQFMRESQSFTARKAKESHLRNGTYPPKGVVNENLAKGAEHRFKPGHPDLRRGRAS